MRIRMAMAQQEPAADVAANLAAAGRTLEQAAALGAGLVCFNQFFLGLVDRFDPAVLASLQEAARRHQLEIITGNLVVSPDGCVATSAFIDNRGELIGFQPEASARCSRLPSLETYTTALGPTAVLSEVEAYDSRADATLNRESAQAVIMQANAISLLELEAIKALALNRSLGPASLIACVSLVGKFEDQRYLGSSLVAQNGEILTEGATERPDLIVADVDPDRFVNYRELREHVTIPELLRQKYNL